MHKGQASHHSRRMWAGNKAVTVCVKSAWARMSLIVGHWLERDERLTCRGALLPLHGAPRPHSQRALVRRTHATRQRSYRDTCMTSV
jgi:hypothetical protein